MTVWFLIGAAYLACIVIVLMFLRGSSGRTRRFG